MEKETPHFNFFTTKAKLFSSYRNPVKINVTQDLRIHWENEMNIYSSQKQRFFLSGTVKVGAQDFTAGTVTTISHRNT